MKTVWQILLLHHSKWRQNHLWGQICELSMSIFLNSSARVQTVQNKILEQVASSSSSSWSMRQEAGKTTCRISQRHSGLAKAEENAHILRTRLGAVSASGNKQKKTIISNTKYIQCIYYNCTYIYIYIYIYLFFLHPNLHCFFPTGSSRLWARRLDSTLCNIITFIGLEVSIWLIDLSRICSQNTMMWSAGFFQVSFVCWVYKQKCLKLIHWSNSTVHPSSRQISIIPKPELREFWGDSPTKP